MGFNLGFKGLNFLFFYLPTLSSLSLHSLTSLLNLQTTLSPYHLTKPSVTRPTTLLNLLLLHLLPTPCSFHFPKLMLLHLPTTPLHCHLIKLPVGAHINYNPDLCHILLYCTPSPCQMPLTFLCVPPMVPSTAQHHCSYWLATPVSHTCVISPLLPL